MSVVVDRSLIVVSEHARRRYAQRVERHDRRALPVDELLEAAAVRPPTPAIVFAHPEEVVAVLVHRGAVLPLDPTSDGRLVVTTVLARWRPPKADLRARREASHSNPGRNPMTRTITGVELARVGTYNLSTGTHTFSRAQLASAVVNAAAKAPRLKLGHGDPRFDGEPALGLVRNLRTVQDGEVLLGDFEDVPGWLLEALPSKYPVAVDRGGRPRRRDARLGDRAARRDGARDRVAGRSQARAGGLGAGGEGGARLEHADVRIHESGGVHEGTGRTR